MSETCYNHLHVHSCYSLLEAACGPDKLVEKAIAQGCKALALTDTNSCSGLYEFNDLCLKKGIKPILGIELNVSENMKSTEDEGPDKRIILLAKNKVGWKNLCILSSEACTTGLVSRPRIDYGLLKTYCEGLIMLTGGMEGHLANCIMYRRYELAEKLLMFCKKIFKDDLYIEVMFHPASHNPASESIERQIYEKSLELGKKFDIKCVCTNDIKYCEQLQAGVQDILYSIKQHKVVKDESRKSLASSEYYMKTRQELEEIFPGHPELFDVTTEIADKIETKLIEKGRSLLPIYEPENGMTPVEFIRSIVYNGLKKKRLFDKEEYKERADYEIRVFEACGFINYFLVLYDFVNWARINNVAMGPGRGSAAGSICLYCMDVTKLDPIKYELLFERFFSVDTKYVVDNKSFGIDTTIKDEKSTDEMQERMFRTCQAHPEFNDQRYFAEEKKMRAMACFESIIKLFVFFVDQNKSVGKINECNSVIAFYSGITECRPSGDFKPREELAAARISPPDVDLDFDIYRRDEIFGYLRQKYGIERTAQIGTSSYFMGKMVIKDVGKTLDIMGDFQRAQEIKAEIKDRRLRSENVDDLVKPRATLDEIDALSSYAETGKTFAEAYAESAELRSGIEQDSNYYYACTQVDGLVRHHGIHAAGMVISKQDIREIIPLKNSKGIICTQFDKDQVEKIGLYKYDLLGVANVSVVDRTIKLIQENRGESIDLDAIEPNDPAVFQMLNEGYTKGIFQFESKMATDLIQLIKLDNFNDLVACNAINRPGPLKAGVGDSYARRKHGQEETVYPCPQMESVLSKTYGLIVYQEQIMNLSRVMASFTKSQADTLRRACGKKDRQLMEEMRQKFVDGCMTNDIEKAIAVEVWQMIEYFGEYGFNLSHSAAYGMLSYYTAFLKRYYPLEYFCALLSSCEDKCDTYEYLCEAKRIGVQCWPVNVNRSGNKYVIEKGGLRLPLSIVDGVGENALKAIIAARPYSTFEEFVKNIDTRVVNTTVIRNLTVIKTTIKNKYGKEFVVELSTGAFAPFSITDPELAQKKFELLKNDMKKQRVSHSRFSSEGLFEDNTVYIKD